MDHSENCCLHYSSIKDDNQVVHIKSLSTWNSILEAARLTNYERMLIISKNVIEGTFPTIPCHKACKTRFTLKRDVDTLKQEQGKRAEEIKQKETLQQEQKEGSRRDGIFTRSKLPISPENRREHEMLPVKCYLLVFIFCQKSKYMLPEEYTRILPLCLEFRADETVKKIYAEFTMTNVSYNVGRC